MLDEAPAGIDVVPIASPATARPIRTPDVRRLTCSSSSDVDPQGHQGEGAFTASWGAAARHCRATHKQIRLRLSRHVRTRSRAISDDKLPQTWCGAYPIASWQDKQMERVLGIGGYFMRATDPASLGAWYRECLGLDADDNGLWRQ